jgi:hypothetical protein
MFRYYFLAGITVLFLYAFDNEMLDLADIRCEKYEQPSPIGYPIRMCSIAFDDKGFIGRLIK